MPNKGSNTLEIGPMSAPRVRSSVPTLERGIDARSSVRDVVSERPSPNPRPGAPALQSVERAISLLQILADAGPLRVTDLADELGVHKSNVSRLLQTLERRGLVDRTEDGSSSFVLGSGLTLLAADASRPRSLAGRSRPVMNELAATIGETVNMNVLTNDGHVLTVEQVVGGDGLTGYNWVGQRSPVGATSAGKVLLAYRPVANVHALIPRRFPRPTPHTLDRKALLDQFAVIQRNGYATCRDELQLGLSAVAAPVFDNGGVIASLSASGPSIRIFGEQHERIVVELVAAAEEISIGVGKRPGVKGGGETTH